MNFYQLQANTITGEEKNMSDYKGDVLLIVNTASECKFTPQYSEIQTLHEIYHDLGLKVLGFPSNQFMNQEKGTNENIKLFCDVRFKITFQLFEKIDVKGNDIHPIYEFLTKNSPGIFNSAGIKWNFTKFLIDREGNIVKRYSPMKKPKDIETDIKKLL